MNKSKKIVSKKMFKKMIKCVNTVYELETLHKEIDEYFEKELGFSSEELWKNDAYVSTIKYGDLTGRTKDNPLNNMFEEMGLVLKS